MNSEATTIARPPRHDDEAGRARADVGLAVGLGVIAWLMLSCLLGAHGARGRDT